MDLSSPTTIPGGTLMPILRLIEPTGYTVPDSTRTITPEAEPQARIELEALAVQHAAQWADFGYHPSDYRIVIDQH